MEEKDIIFVPHSDVGTNDIEIVNQHKNLINEGKYSDATALLESECFNKGARASLLNSMQNKIRQLQLYFLNEFNPDKDSYISDVEPDEDFMNEHGYIHWLQPWD